MPANRVVTTISQPVPRAASPAQPPAPAPDRDWVDRHAIGLWRFLRCLGADPNLADELCQEAFVLCWQKGAHTAAPAVVGAFLRRTARFLLLRARRSAAAAERRHAALAAELARAEALWQRDCADDGEGLLAALRRCLQRLSGRAAQAMTLHYGEGCSRAAIATELGLRENGVKTLLQRTRALLRQCIERSQHDTP